MHPTTCFNACRSADAHTADTPPLPLGERLGPLLERQRLKIIHLARSLSVLVGTGRAPLRPRTSEEPDEVAQTPLASPQPTLAVPDEISTYAQLQQLIHKALRIQHPEWVQPNGDSSLCDAYEARLAELLKRFTPQGGEFDTYRAMDHPLNRHHTTIP